MINKLRTIPFISTIEQDALETIIARGFVHIKTCKKGEYILHQNKTYEDLYMIITGQCYSEMIDLSGKNVLIDDFYNGDLLAAGVLFSQDNILPVSVIAKSPCEIAIITRNGVLELCRTSENFLLGYMRLISDKITFLTQKLYFISFKTIRSKIAGYLLSKLKAGKEYVVIDMSLEALSNYFGVTRPSLSRVIGELENENIISHEKNRYSILDKNRLSALL